MIISTTAPTLALPGIQHSFFSRLGGVSTGIYASLNCGPGSGDAKDAVQENRARVAATFNQPPEKLLTCHQIHSARAVVVEEPWQGMPPEADALVTTRPGLLLGALGADCAPVLLADSEARVVAAAHAGWKGAKAGIIESAITRMVECGARREHIRAGIGPCIGWNSYEVGGEFMENLLAESAKNAAFFKPAATPEKRFFDLRSYVSSKLQAAGVTAIWQSMADTCAEEATYFSYRRACLRGEPGYGRQIAVITLT